MPTFACQLCGTTFVRRTQPIIPRYCSSKCGAIASGLAKRRPLIERLKEWVRRCDHGEDCPYCCWPWQGACTSIGYGKMQVEGKTDLAHRITWTVWHQRPIPDARNVLHYCLAHVCCNPQHLFLATDLAMRRFAVQQGTQVRGDRSGKSKIRERDIVPIFVLHHLGQDSYQITDTYGVHSTTILAILNRKTFGHVPVEDVLRTLRPKPGPFMDRESEEYRAYQRAWYYANRPERLINAKIQSARRRAREAAITGNDLSTAQWREILVDYRHHCAYCPPDCSDCRFHRHTLEPDHILSVAQGGAATLWNVIPACRTHNASKGAGPVLSPIQPLLLTIAKPKTPKDQ